MIYIDDVKTTPNPVETGGKVKIEVTLHEEYERAKKYVHGYPYRYGEKGVGK